MAAPYGRPLLIGIAIGVLVAADVQVVPGGGTEPGIDSAPRLARGPAGAMQAVWHLPHGDLLLATLGAGLIAFGAYGLLEARWRRLLGR